ncbi:MAG: hypothetical protein U1D30_23260 [Planctomycetota bacterium]
MDGITFASSPVLNWSEYGFRLVLDAGFGALLRRAVVVVIEGLAPRCSPLRKGRTQQERRFASTDDSRRPC